MRNEHIVNDVKADNVVDFVYRENITFYLQEEYNSLL